MPADKIDAILMAAGFSKRFGGSDKLLHPFCQKPLVQHTLNLVCSLPFWNNIFIVCANPAVAAIAKEYPVQIIPNPNPSRGQRESIRLGVLHSSADYYLFFPCDMPLLTAEVVEKVVAARKPGTIVQPAYQATPASPTLFSNTFRQGLLSLANGQSGKALKTGAAGQVITVEISSPLPLTDADTPEALAKLEKLAKPG